MGEIHVKALAKIDGVEVVSVAGRTEDGVKEFAAKWSIPHHLHQSRGVHRPPGRGRGDPDDAERSASRPDAAGAAKGKHVQVEIPMALNLADSEHMLDEAKKAGKALHGDAHAPLREPAPRNPQAHPGRHVPPASHGGRDLFLPSHESEHARPAAIVGGQPALASRLPLGRSGSLDSQRAKLGRLGTEGT